MERIDSTEITVRIITNKRTYEKKFNDMAKANDYYDGIIIQINDE